MVAKLHPVVWAFAGGCLSGAAVIGVVFIGVAREDAKTPERDVPSARTAEQHQKTSADSLADDAQAAHEANDDSNAAADAPASPLKKAELAGDHPAEDGHSIADILLRLEAAYRQDLAAPPPAPTTTPAAHAPKLAAHEIAAHEEAAVAAAAPAVSPATAPAAPAPEMRAPETPPQPIVLASREEAPTTNVFNGNVQQNTNVGSVQQGDVYVMPSVVPYAPYYARPNSPSYVPPANAPRPGIPRAVHFTRNPNPAGSGVFNYSIDGPFKYPVDLVH